MFGDPGSRSSLSLDLDMSWGIVLQAYRCLKNDDEDPRYKNPLQEWGEEVEDGAVYGVTLRRVRTESPSGDLLAVAASPGYVHYKTCKVRSIRAGTLENLVENLLVEYQGSDPGYVPTFLSTYRAFTSSEKVLELLLDRHLEKVGDKESAMPGSPVPDTPSVQRVVRGVLQTWIERHPQDFRDSSRCLQLISSYLSQDCRENPSQLLRLVKSLEEEGEHDSSPKDWRSITRPAEGDYDTSENTTSLLSYPPQDVAEQLTLIDVDLFQKLQSCHCLGSIWSQRDKKENRHVAPSVRATVAQFNAVTACVTASVLNDIQMKPQMRAKVLEKWISIAQYCRFLRNFSSLRAILSALQSNSIYRLKRTWAAVSRDNLNIFHKLSAIFSDENNHEMSREILTKDEIPLRRTNSARNEPRPLQRSASQVRSTRPAQGTVPYLGTFLTDLVMLDTALPDNVEGGLINFEKRRKEYEVLAKIQKLQLTCRHYVLTPKPEILQAFYTHRQLTEDQSYRISRSIEPPADSCPNSPRIRRKLTKRFSSLLLGSEVFSPKMNGDRVSPSGSCSSCEIDEGIIAALCPAEPVAAKDRGNMVEPLTPPNTPGREDAPRCVSSPRSPVSPSLPVYNQQIADLCIIRVSMENTHGNLYKSILLTSQDKSRIVIQRALHKHNIESCKPDDFQLVQLLSEGKELTIPDTANVYYAMNTSANFDFVLRRRVKIS
ncbi:ral guanine nucleotide dissociation stimulator-like 3 isoform X1 [Hyla sarda]|uniref:ral guanine nucleotide dissociation stimulator-like 3 isoform X1 n=1 Tax=Hyla sarda TaxID=327740 RepID=UPI0024C23EE6|nr:ral guanine nucleotide dissociation stimulator-like 3 isoform X1 [Hyla sarda]XP_056426374.1 ral guanine nucleotide dissociation stimulator-like 3 isoform X1 [Hyla sarda]